MKIVFNNVDYEIDITQLQDSVIALKNHAASMLAGETGVIIDDSVFELDLGAFITKLTNHITTLPTGVVPVMVNDTTYEVGGLDSAFNRITTVLEEMAAENTTILVVTEAYSAIQNGSILALE